MKKTIVSLIFTIPCLLLVAQQDPQYSQYMFNQLALNPAYAGSREVFAVGLTARKQWTGIEGSPETDVFSIQSPLRKRRNGLGCEIFSEAIGPKKVGGLSASYAYRIPFLQGKLALGLKAGFISYKYDWMAIHYKDQNEPYLLMWQTQGKQTAFDAQFGMYYYTKSFYWGLSLTHLTQAEITSGTDSLSPAHLAHHAFMTVGKGFEVNENLVLNPSVYIKMVQGSPLGLDLNFNVQIKQKIWLGVSLRREYGFVVLTEFQLTEKLRFGYSYDIGLNKIGTIGKASHEIMLGYDINIFKPKTVAPRYL